jgi:hypothetical protein
MQNWSGGASVIQHYQKRQRLSLYELDGNSYEDEFTTELTVKNMFCFSGLCRLPR